MKREYKLIIIIIISGLLAFLIFKFHKEDQIRMVAIGDGIAYGETFHNIKGISYNEYLKDNINNVDYNDLYVGKNYSLDNFINDFINNDIKEKESLYLKQILHKANIITVCFGEEELTKKSITNDLNIEYIKKFLNNYSLIIKNIKMVSDANIFIVGLYENKYLSNTNVILLNSGLSNIANNYDVTFINISDLLKEEDYFSNSNSIYFNYKAHKKIADMILNSKGVAL